jgi:hypothetical protein
MGLQLCTTALGRVNFLQTPLSEKTYRYLIIKEPTVIDSVEVTSAESVTDIP